MSYIHLTINEREMLMRLKAKGLTIRSIALRLKRSPSTISREFADALSQVIGKQVPGILDQEFRCHRDWVAFNPLYNLPAIDPGQPD